MKTIITFSSLIMSIVLFSSCESNMSITKRHYNNGYYIANSKIKHNDNNQKEMGTEIPTKTILSLNSIQNKIENNKINMDTIHNSFVDNNDMVASNNKMPGKTNSHNIIKHAIQQQAQILKQVKKQHKRNIFRKNKII